MTTKQDLIQLAESASPGYIGLNVPVVSQHFFDHADLFNLDTETHYNLAKYIQDASYAEKKNLFESRGIKVLMLCLSLTKAIHACREIENGETREEALIQNRRNIWIYEVNDGFKSLYFVLEHEATTPMLGEKTLDSVQIQKDKERSEKVRALFKNRKTSNDNPFK